MYFKTDEYHFKIEVIFRPLIIYQKSNYHEKQTGQSIC
jgi:hypothetical protein